MLQNMRMSCSLLALMTIGLSSCSLGRVIFPAEFDKKTGFQLTKTPNASLAVLGVRYDGLIQAVEITSSNSQSTGVFSGNERALVVDLIISNKSLKTDFFECVLRGTNGKTIDPGPSKKDSGPNVVNINPVEVKVGTDRKFEITFGIREDVSKEVQLDCGPGVWENLVLPP